MDDPFTTDILGDYTADQSTSLSGLVVAGGVLAVSTTDDHSFHNAEVSLTDSCSVVKVIPGAANSHLIYIAVFVDDSNFLMMQDYLSDDTGVRIYQFVAGANTSLGTIVRPESLTGGGAPCWFKLTVVGNVVAGSIYDIDPASGVPPFSTKSILLGGAAKVALGEGVSKHPGLRLGTGGGSTPTSWTLDDWRVKSLPAPRTVF